MAWKKLPTSVELTADQVLALVDYAGNAFLLAERLGIGTKPVEQFPLDEDEIATVAELPALSAKGKKKLAKKGSGVTVSGVAGMVMIASEALVRAEPKKQIALFNIARKLAYCLQANITLADIPAETKAVSTEKGLPDWRDEAGW